MKMKASDDLNVSAIELAAFTADLLAATGVSRSDAATVAHALVDADLEGHASHGVMLVEMYAERIRKGSVSPTARPVVVSDKDGAVVLDARHCLGHLSSDQAMALCVERAHRFAAGIVAVRHGFHFGTARRFALAAARMDCVGIAMCNTRPLMPAPGGAERVVGNNPVAIAIPCDGPIPIVVDMAMSEAAMGKIRAADKAGRSIPQSWAVRADGSPTTDPAEAIRGMLLPAAGPKGFALAFIIDLMSGLLSGGAVGDAVQPLYGDMTMPYDCSHLFIAIDTAHFGDPAVIRAAASKAAGRVRASKVAPGGAQVFSPGEIEWQTRQSAQGRVKLSRAVAETLVKLAGELEVSPASFMNSSEQRKDQ
jgi:LDH2 family malate/lactate/ureidoglycolate dehydrogenase